MMVLGVDSRQLLTIASKELWDRVRNRWVIAIAVVFTLFAVMIAYFGAAQQGSLGFKGLEVTIASLVSLAIYLIPLIALILGYDAVVGERERGSLDLLLAMPLTRIELLLGKYLGLSAALALATLLGFGVAGVMIATQVEWNALFHYLGFVITAVLMGMAFLSMAMAVSVIATDRTRASGIAIGLWFFYVLIFDLLLLAALVAAGDKLQGEFIPYLLLLNPADIFRILNIFSMQEVQSMYGLATLMPERLTEPLWLTSALLVWIVSPLLLAGWRLTRE